LRGADVTLSPAIKSAVRLAAAVGLALLVVLVLREQRSRDGALEQAKATLLAQIDEVTTATAQQGSGRFATARDSLEREAQGYPGDLVDPKLQARQKVDALLGRAALYVRLPVDHFVEPAAFERGLAESRLDSFPLCLKDPPAGRTEAELIKS